VARVVWDTYRHFDTHPTRDVVPILVQDPARDRLRVMPAATRGPTSPGGAARPLIPANGQSAQLRSDRPTRW